MDEQRGWQHSAPLDPRALNPVTSGGLVEKACRNGDGGWNPQILAVGLNYRQAPVALRERLAFPVRDLEESLSELKRYVPEGAILSTCSTTGCSNSTASSS